MSGHGQRQRSGGTARRRVAPWVAPGIGAAGAALAVVGSLLTWGTVNHPMWGEQEIAGLDGDGMWTLWLSLGALLLFLGTPVARLPLLSAVAGLLAVGAAGLGGLNAFGPDRSARIYVREVLGRAGDGEQEIFGLLLDHGSAAGVWLVLAAALVSVAAAVWTVVQAGALLPVEEEVRHVEEELAKR
ncbi:hypothetical protein [Streptomyces avicenniae]|uniref:hypothetical protein n=1 Tax=Streptomyces avicenniae TaxID=500153 RepID=UPI00167E304B|nr:hypothetical protein [Streptomyces avicenniae]